MIRYGIVGVGGFATTWVRSLETLERLGKARLAAAVVRDPAKYEREVARLRANGCAVYPSLDALLGGGRDAIDVVGLPTGISQHAPMGIQAMTAGFNVLIEKPVAATVQEADELGAVESRTGRWCAVGYQFIYSPTIQWLREKLRQGNLGALRAARTSIGWPRGTSYYQRNPWAGQLRDGNAWVLDGPATNATAHHLTNMLYLASEAAGGSAIATVRAELYRARSIASYDTSCIEVTMSDGARLLHCVSHALDEHLSPVTEIDCERGTIRWQADENAAVIQHEDGRVESFADPDLARLNTRVFEQVARVAAGEDRRPLCGLAESRPQVLAIDLAFESSGGITTIPDRLIYPASAPDGSALACVEGMGELLTAARTRGLMFSELGASWARPSEPVPAAGYARFPRSEAPRASLGD